MVVDGGWWAENRGWLGLAACLVWGWLPLGHGIVWGLTGHDLRQVGTGNVSVSAAFRQVGSRVGIWVALAEIVRGVLPVWIAGQLGDPLWQVLVLLPLVVGRFCGRGGGVTNVVWGVVFYAPLVALSTGLTGLGILVLTRRRLLAARLGCLSAALWVAVWQQSPHQTLAMLSLAVLVIGMNLLQKDDMAVAKLWVRLREARDPQRWGGKAAHLAQLQQAGFTVPEGWVLAAAGDISTIPTAVLAALVTPEHSLWIVRSSAVGEDSSASSAAGQYTSIPDIRTLDQLTAAIAHCRQAYNSPAATTYRQTHPSGSTVTSSGLAVLIQQQIMGKVSGVTFSRHPLHGGSQVVVEAVLGGAAGVVSGQVQPLHLEIAGDQDPQDLDESTLPFPFPLAEVVQVSRRIEAHFHGIPQDIEWTWDGETLWILQSRPITNLRPIWTRTIASEVIPGAIRPLTWSINRPLTCGVWGELFSLVLGQSAQHLDFNQTATLLGSHAYFNATLLGEIFRQMGLPEQGLEFLLRGGKMGKPPRSAYTHLLACLPGLARLIGREWRLVQDFAQADQHTFQPLLRQLEIQLETQALSKQDPQELLHWAEAILQALRPATYFNIVGPIGLAIRRHILNVPDAALSSRSLPEVAFAEALQNLASQLRQSLQPDLPLSPQAQMEAALHRDPFAQVVAELLNNYGWLSQVGTDIAIPCWREQPEILRHLIITLALQPPASRVPAVLSSFPPAQWRVRQCQSRVDLKGRITQVYLQLLAYLRWMILALESHWIEKGILENPGDIFYLEWPEIREGIQTQSNAYEKWKAQIKQRHQAFLDDQQQSVPAVVYGSHLPQPEFLSPTLHPCENQLRGIPASVGCVEGEIKIFQSIDRVNLPSSQDGWRAGLILVVPYTDAGWTPMLIAAKAIISEVGGQLSHGAIVAREYGIPAVMNVEQASQKLRDGQWVRVDGYRGTVEILPKP
ncbi:MAG: glycerol-3-phosphate acyltransferase [Cyanobacteriota bacterium]|nr:glycerol-3-phosphate acyltransferase [Cyanobacteriota bacterium]